MFKCVQHMGVQGRRDAHTSEGGRKVLDVAFVQQCVRHMYDLGPTP